MANKVKVFGETYSSDIVELLAGKRGATKVEKALLPVLEAINNPMELPFLIDEIKALNATDKLRLALVRVQVHSEQNMHEDLNMYQKRLYAAQTMEMLLFGELCMEGSKEKKKKSGQKRKKG